MTAYIFDSETTGLTDPQIVEAAWARLSGTPKDFAPEKFYRERFCPSKPIEFGALATHHILDETLSRNSPSSTFTLPPDCLYLIGHNIDYDWGVAGKPAGIKRICTLALARAFWPHLDSHSLGALLYFVDRQAASARLEGSHSALGDVKNCAVLLSYMAREVLGSVTSWEELWRLSERARIPDFAPFGKYKGQAVEDIPRSYALWAQRQPDFDPYFMQALREKVL
jgi:exodeoxyribonuclease X